MKPIDVKDKTCINLIKKISDKDPKFKAGGHVRISKYRNIFSNRHIPNCSEEVFVVHKVNAVPWTCVINDPNS